MTITMYLSLISGSGAVLSGEFTPAAAIQEAIDIMCGEILSVHTRHGTTSHMYLGSEETL